MPTLKELLDITDAATIDSEPHSWRCINRGKEIEFINNNTLAVLRVPINQEAKEFNNNSWLFTSITSKPVWLDLYKFIPVTPQSL